MADITANKQRGRPFRPGQSGNLGGRPVGARNRFGRAFLEALEADFAAHGGEVIEACREKQPHKYLAICASLLPKEFALEIEADITHKIDDYRQHFQTALRYIGADSLLLEHTIDHTDG